MRMELCHHLKASNRFLGLLREPFPLYLPLRRLADGGPQVSSKAFAVTSLKKRQEQRHAASFFEGTSLALRHGS